ncbi:MAG: response regulator, partial [Bacteroidota bacterium]
NNLEATLKISASEKDIFFKMSKEATIPDMHFGDPVRLYQILVNLGGNAIKFTSDGGVEIKVHLKEKRPEGNLLRFSVMDTGIGIPYHLQGHIFGQFTQADDRVSKRFGGTGLGLSIVQKLVEVFDGHLELDSQVDKGSTFHVDLLLLNSVKQSKADKERKKITQLSEDQRAELKVILAEDNPINQVFAASALNRLGIKVEIAVNGKEVIDLLRKQDYDLILMDVQMPEMDGLETTRYIRKHFSGHNQKIKIIAVTAAVMKKEIDNCFAAGVDQYLSKPFNPDDLMEKITDLMT